MHALQITETGDLSELTGPTGLYGRMLTRLVEYPIWVLLFTIALLISVFISYGHFGKGVEFFPNIEPESANLDIRARGDLSLDEKDALVRQSGTTSAWYT